MPELANDERIAALEAENARLAAVLENLIARAWNINRLAAQEAHNSLRSGDDSALKARLDAARHDGRMDQVADDAMAWQRAEQTEQERDSLRAQLAERDAQVERLRSFMIVVEPPYASDAPRQAWYERKAALLAETPEQSLAAVREQARREAIVKAAGPIATAVLDFLAEQKYQGEEILHAIVCCDFVSRSRMEDAIARVIRELAAQPAKEPRP